MIYTSAGGILHLVSGPVIAALWRRQPPLVPVGVSYESDPTRIEAILMEEASSAIGHVPGLLAGPVPFVRFVPGF